jgi:hypothetical protein
MINQSLDQVLNSITYSRLLITFEAIDDVELPPYKGATFRGCMGDAFRRLVCKYPGQPCEKCRLQNDCLFALMYSKPLERDHPAFGRFTLPPRPYIINPMSDRETHFPPGSRFWFDLILIGGVVQHLVPVLPSLFLQMGEGGIGNGRGRFRPVSLEHSNSSGQFELLPAIGNPYTLTFNDTPVNHLANRVSLRFENPLRLLSGRKPMQEPPEFERLIRNLALRMTLLANIYCQAPWIDYEQPDSDLVDVTISNHDLQWANWQHFSGTKKLNMNFDGHTGTIKYKGNLSGWSQLLAAGEILHAGSTATFGLGKYSIMPDE